MSRETRLLGAGRQLQRAEERLDGGYRRMPERRRNLYRLHDARVPGQVHAVHGRASGREGFIRGSSALGGAVSRCATLRIIRE